MYLIKLNVFILFCYCIVLCHRIWHFNYKIKVFELKYENYITPMLYVNIDMNYIVKVKPIKSIFVYYECITVSICIYFKMSDLFKFVLNRHNIRTFIYIWFIISNDWQDYLIFQRLKKYNIIKLFIDLTLELSKQDEYH